MSSSQESLTLAPSGVRPPSATAQDRFSGMSATQTASSSRPPGDEVAVPGRHSLPRLPVGPATASSARMVPPSGAIFPAPSPKELEEAAVRKKQKSARDAELAMLMEQASIDEKGKAAGWRQSSHDRGHFPSPARSLPQETNNKALTEPRPISGLKPKVHRLKKNCVVQFGDQEGIGGLRSRPGYTIQAFLDGGLWGDPSLIIRFKTNKLGRASMPLDREPHRQDFFDLRLSAGHVADGDAADQDQALFMLDDFQWKFLSTVSTLD